MNDFYNKTKKLSHKHMRELMGLCAAVSILLVAAAVISGSNRINNLFAENHIGSGSQAACAFWQTCDIFVGVYGFKANPNPVIIGNNITISWTGYNADQCILYGPTIGGTSSKKGGTGGGPSGAAYVAGSGSYTTGPIATTTTYGIQCTNSGGWTSGTSAYYTMKAYAANPGATTTLASFVADPTTVVSGNTSKLSWGGTKGTAFSSCELKGGQFTVASSKNGRGGQGGSGDSKGRTLGTFFTDFPGSVFTDPLTATTTYSINCYDASVGASTGWLSATVGISAAAAPDACSNIAGTQATIPANGSASAGVCTCNTGYQLTGASCVKQVITLCSNGLGNSYAPSCKCSGGQVQSGAVCVSAPVSTCSNGLANSYAPSCTCSSNELQSGASCVLKGVINSLTVNPTRVLKGKPVTISWSTTGMKLCSLSALASGGTSIISPSSSLVNSSLQGVVIDSKTIVTLNCSDFSGAPYSSSVTVNLVPQTIEQ